MASERQFFGRPGGDYDWAARNADAAFADLEKSEETLGRLGKGLNKRVWLLRLSRPAGSYWFVLVRLNILF